LYLYRVGVEAQKGDIRQSGTVSVVY
jgi:hypothetical protein